MPRLLVRYKKEVVPRLMSELGYQNPYQIPKLEKITLNIGLGRAREDPASLEHAVQDLATITGQKPVVALAKKAISNFKLKINDPVGCFVTLRGWKMYEFLDRLITVALPRERDFNGLPVRAFDGRGSYNFGLQEQIVFPEIDYDKIDKIRGLQITLVTTAKTDEEAYGLLNALGFPLKGALRKKSEESVKN